MTRIGSAAILLLMAATSVSAQQLRVRIVDHASRQPIVGVLVRVVDDANVEIAAETGADGFFAIEHIEPGSHTLIIEHPGYATVRQPLVIEARGAVTVPAIMLKSTAVTLDTLQVEARARDRRLDLRGADPTHVLSGARLAQLEKMSVSGPGVIRQLAAGLRVRETGFRSVCVESVRRYMSMRDIMTGGLSGGCAMVVVVLDGVVVGNGSHLLARDEHRALRERRVRASGTGGSAVRHGSERNRRDRALDARVRTSPERGTQSRRRLASGIA